MPTPPTTLRGRRTRDALISAGRKIFERDGFLNARITDIAAEARVAHGTFYTHFSTKEDLFREVATILLPESPAAPRPFEYLGREQTIRGIAKATRKYLVTYRQDARLMGVVEQVATFDEGIQDILTRRSVAFIARAEAQIVVLQRHEVVSPDIDPYATALALTSMVSRYANSTLVGNPAVTQPIDFEVSVRTLTWIWASAIGLGVQYIEVAALCDTPE